jgi:uncharacterized damage-inducible protein DinB
MLASTLLSLAFLSLPVAHADQAGPLTGTWTGHMGPTQAGGTAITVQLKSAAKAVSGTAAAAPQAAAQAPADPGLEAARRGFVEVSGWVARAAELVPADKYSYRPAPNVRTFGQLVAHVVDGYQYYCARGAGRTAEWTDATEKGAVEKAGIVQRLKQAGDACTPAYATGGQIAPLMENVGHTSLHYGNMITYMRMLGLTPPSS